MLVVALEIFEEGLPVGKVGAVLDAVVCCKDAFAFEDFLQEALGFVVTHGVVAVLRDDAVAVKGKLFIF